MGDTEKQRWTPPTVTEFDIAERTQLGGAGLDDGLDPGGLDDGGGNGGGNGGAAPAS